MSRFAESSRVLPGAGDRVLVAGLGRSGLAAAQALRSLGATVTVTDDRRDEAVTERATALDVRSVLGAMDPALAAEADLIVVSPGVAPTAPILDAARNARIPVWSEVELGWRMSRVPVLGVTGTNGKTTTTQMLAAALRSAGIAATEAGNIGTPLCRAVAGDWQAIVCELSSFQLHHIWGFHAPVAVLLNISEDHLDWHGTYRDYAADKARLFQNQDVADTAVVLDDPDCLRLAETKAGVVAFSASGLPAGGAGVRDGWIEVPQGPVAELSALPFRSAPMIADAVAAAAAACAHGAAPEAVAASLGGFQPAEHRLETVAVANGITYVNDSKATNPHATLAALEGMQRVVLIAGGRNKDLDLSPLAATGSVTAAVAIGEAAKDIQKAFLARGLPVEHAVSMEDAVDRASRIARPGDTVLLSPGCASFDMFADYRARGEAFRAAVKRIASIEGGSS